MLTVRIKTNHTDIISTAMFELIESFNNIPIDLGSLPDEQRELERCKGFVTIQTIIDDHVSRLIDQLDELVLDELAPPNILDAYKELKRFTSKLYVLDFAEKCKQGVALNDLP